MTGTVSLCTRPAAEKIGQSCRQIAHKVDARGHLSKSHSVIGRDLVSFNARRTRHQHLCFLIAFSIIKIIRKIFQKYK